MININGNILITTDWHFGLKNNQDKWLGTLINITDQINNYINKNEVEHLIFCGDLFHDRNDISVKIINAAISCIEKLSANCKIYLIVGNHDLVDNVHPELNSIKIFKHTKNVTVIEDATEVSINGNKSIFVPWISNILEYRSNTFDMMFGHFDIPHDYLMENRMDRMYKSKKYTKEEIINYSKNEKLLREDGIDGLDVNTDIVIDSFIHHKPASQLIGDWINVVKEGGTIFAGHVHNRHEFIANRRKFIFVGSPYQQTAGECDSNDGFYTLSKNNKICFHELNGIPKFVDVKISDIINEGINEFDYSTLTNNVIHKIIDVELTPAEINEIDRKINSANPFHENASTFAISKVSYTDIDGNVITNSMESIRKSPMIYLKNYLNSIDQKRFNDDGIDKDFVIDILKKYIEPGEKKNDEKSKNDNNGQN